MFLLKDITILKDKKALRDLPKGKLLINTINAHSYNTALKDEAFAEALMKGDVLIPDGASIVMACRWLKAKSRPTERIAGWDLFVYEMGKLNVESLGLRGEGDSSRAQNVESLELSVEGDSSQAQNDESLELRVERDSSQAQNDRTDDDGNVEGLGLSVEGDSSRAQNVESLELSVEGDSSQAQNDRTNDDGNVESLGLRVEGDSSQAQNDESLELRVERDSSQAQNDRTDDDGNVEGLGMSVEGDSSQAQNIESLGFRGERRKKKVMFMGSSEKVLTLIKERAAVDYPNVEVITYSPPYKPEFTDEENAEMVRAINEAKPDLLWIGMTAPKQEKWTYKHWGELDIDCHVGTIGAVFDFYAGTMKRAPLWWQEHSLEWLYRLLKEPKRMWRRYLVGNALFLWNVIKLKVKS